MQVEHPIIGTKMRLQDPGTLQVRRDVSGSDGGLRWGKHLSDRWGCFPYFPVDKWRPLVDAGGNYTC